MPDLFVEVRLRRWNAETDPPLAIEPGIIAARTLPFENLTNGTSAYDDAAAVLDDFEQRGVHLMAERLKPGKRRVS